MRIPHITSVLCILVSTLSASAAERCEDISIVVAAAVMSKPKIADVLKKNPQKGTLGEPWRYLWFAYKEQLDKLRVPESEQEYMFKTIGTVSFSKKLEVDVDILRDYFYLRCRRKERGLSSTPLASIPAASLTHCWDAVKNRTEFQACEEKLMEGKSKSAH
jgi:hypothetical protein